jgi:hypothetical protein
MSELRFGRATSLTMAQCSKVICIGVRLRPFGFNAQERPCRRMAKLPDFLQWHTTLFGSIFTTPG